MSACVFACWCVRVCSLAQQLKNANNLLPSNGTHMHLTLAVADAAHAAAAPQAPMLVQLQGSTITANCVQGGLMWLRLVNTSLTDTNITGNTAAAAPPAATATKDAGSSSSGAALRTSAADAAAAVVWQGQQGQRGDDATAAGIKGWPALNFCNVGVQLSALIRVHGPAGFDMLRWVGLTRVLS